MMPLGRTHSVYVSRRGTELLIVKNLIHRHATMSIDKLLHGKFTPNSFSSPNVHCTSRHGAMQGLWKNDLLTMQ